VLEIFPTLLLIARLHFLAQLCALLVSIEEDEFVPRNYTQALVPFFPAKEKGSVSFLFL
jgi:hypothetical protein